MKKVRVIFAAMLSVIASLLGSGRTSRSVDTRPGSKTVRLPPMFLRRASGRSCLPLVRKGDKQKRPSLRRMGWGR